MGYVYKFPLNMRNTVVMLNLFQNLKTNETQKRVQGENFSYFSGICYISPVLIVLCSRKISYIITHKKEIY